jgi:hypothetical protein
MLNASFPETITWEGMEEIEATIAWLEPPARGRGQLNALYLVGRQSSLGTALGALAALDQFTPDALKGETYYAVLCAVFLASARPFDPIYIPRKFERLVDAIIEEPSQLKRTIRESHLIGTLASREEIKQAIRFLCDRKVLEPIANGEYLVSKRPVRKLTVR